VRKIDDLRETLVAVNGLLGWGFLSPDTRKQLEELKVEFQAELAFIFAQQKDMAAD
jgi:hypothetical protein